MNYFQCLLTHSRCYKQRKDSTLTVHGIVVHDTAGGNPYLKRYVQPCTGDNNYDANMLKLGKNTYDNDWNHDMTYSKGVHGFIGKLQDGSLAVVQTLPYGIKCNGCGSGTKGSLNNSYLQFEICDDKYASKSYCDETYALAVEYAAFLCQQFKLDPTGTFTYSGSKGNVKVPVITCHIDAHNLGLASNHGDVLEWWEKYGHSMQQFRLDVKAQIQKNTAATASTTATAASTASSATSSVATAQKSSSATTTTAATSPVLKCGTTGKEIQQYLNTNYKAALQKALGDLLVVDGSTGPLTKKAVAAAIQWELNKLGAGLTIDGKFGPASKTAFDKYAGTLKKGNKGIFVTLLQILIRCYSITLSGGIDGSFGSGTFAATNTLLKKKSLDADGTVTGSDLRVIFS